MRGRINQVERTVKKKRKETLAGIAFLLTCLALSCSDDLAGNQDSFAETTKTAPAVFPAPSGTTHEALVVKVIDGDTVELASGERVRYIGMDTPEMGPPPKCGAEAARARNRQLVEGKLVELLPGPEDRDVYGRLLRYVFAAQTFVNAELVSEGYALAKTYHPDEQYHELFSRLGREAEGAGRGLWRTCGW